MNIGDKISRERKAKGLSQKELASLLNVSDKLISKWESGRATPSVDYIARLCTIFDKDFNYFLQSDQPSQGNTSQGYAQTAVGVAKSDKPTDRKRKVAFVLILVSLIIFICGIFAISHLLFVPFIFNWQNVRLLNDYAQNSFEGDFFDINLTVKSYSDGKEVSSASIIYQAKIEDGKASYYEFNDDDGRTVIYKDGIEYTKNSSYSSGYRKKINLDGLSLSELYSYYQLEANEEFLSVLDLQDDNFINNIKKEGSVFYFDIDKDSLGEIDSSFSSASSIKGKAVVAMNKLKEMELSIKFDSNKIVAYFEFNLSKPTFTINHVENLAELDWIVDDRTQLSDLESLLPSYNVNAIENTSGVTDILTSDEKIIYTTSTRGSQREEYNLTNLYIYDIASQSTQSVPLFESESIKVKADFSLTNPHYCHLYKNYFLLSCIDTDEIGLRFFLIDLDTLEATQVRSMYSFYARDNYVVAMSDFSGHYALYDLDSENPLEDYVYEQRVYGCDDVIYIDKYYNCYYANLDSTANRNVKYFNIETGAKGELEVHFIISQVGDYIWMLMRNNIYAYAFDGENFNLVRTIVCEENLYNFTQHSFYSQEKDTICFDNWLIRNASNPAIARLEKLLDVPNDTYTTLIYKDLILASSETNPNYTNIIYYNSSQPPIYLEQIDYDNKGYYHFIYNDRLYLIDDDTIYEIY